MCSALKEVSQTPLSIHILDQGYELRRYIHVGLSVCLFLVKLVSQFWSYIDETGPSINCTQYICRNRPDRITISYSCHKNYRIEINL